MHRHLPGRSIVRKVCRIVQGSGGQKGQPGVCIIIWTGARGGRGAGFGVMVDASLSAIASPAAIPSLHIARAASGGVFNAHDAYDYIVEAQQRLADMFGLSAHVDIVRCELPGGVGLGTASQAVIATLLATIRCHERGNDRLPISLNSWKTIRKVSGRGRGSFIGIHGAERGGVIITNDGDRPLRQLMSGNAPERVGDFGRLLVWPVWWGITLIVPKFDSGITPEKEKNLMQQAFEPWERELANQIVQHDLLAALADTNLPAFAAACRELLGVESKHREVRSVRDFTRRLLYDEANRFPHNAVMLSGAGPTIGIVSAHNQRLRLEKEYGDVADIFGPFGTAPTGLVWLPNSTEPDLPRLRQQLAQRSRLQSATPVQAPIAVAAPALNLDLITPLAAPPAYRVDIHAYSRIHLSLLLMGGAYFRKYGDIGLTVDDDGLATVVIAEPAFTPPHEINYRSRLYEGPRLQIVSQYPKMPDGSDAADITKLGKTLEHCLAQLDQRYRDRLILPCARLTITRRPPAHSGLGSETQLKLALIAACFRIYNLQAPDEVLVQLSGRGATSSVGCVAFSQGGAVVGLGQPLAEVGDTVFTPSSSGWPTKPLQVLRRFDVPQDLHITLVRVNVGRDKGISGSQELSVFERATPKAHDDSLRGLESAFTGVAPALMAGAAGIPTLRRAVDILHQPGCFKYDELREQTQTTQQLFAQLHRHFSAYAVGLSSMADKSETPPVPPEAYWRGRLKDDAAAGLV